MRIVDNAIIVLALLSMTGCIEKIAIKAAKQADNAAASSAGHRSNLDNIGGSSKFEEPIDTNDVVSNDLLSPIRTSRDLMDVAIESMMLQDSIPNNSKEENKN